jgi:arabinogalactan oligomer/maltooligosaccharide transport system substrate-binding protein
MKRIASLILFIMLASILVACGGGEGDGGGQATESPPAAEEPPAGETGTEASPEASPDDEAAAPDATPADGVTAGAGAVDLSNVTCEEGLTWWHAIQEGSGEEQFVQGKAQEFTEQTGVDVTLLNVQFTELPRTFIQSVPAGQGPDLVYGPNDWIGQFAEGGFIADLTEQVDTSEYLENAAEAVTYNGSVYGVPERVEALTQYYNTAILDEPLQSFEDTQERAGQLEEGQYVLAYDIGNAYFSFPFLYAVGGELFDEQGNFALTEEAATEWLTALRDLQQNANLPPEITGPAASALFSGGQAGATFSGPWEIQNLAQAGVDFEWQLAKLPQVNGQDARPFLGTYAFYVSSQSPCQEAATTFGRWMSSVETELEWVEEVEIGHLPAIQAAYDDPALANNEVILAFQEQAETSTPFPNVPEISVVWDPAANAINQVLSGTDPAAAAQEMIRAIEAGIGE